MAKKRQAWLWILGALLFWGGVGMYFVLHPALPGYVKLPPGSQLEYSYNVGLAKLWGPKNYYRIHSPLGAWQTAHYLQRASAPPQSSVTVRRLSDSPPERSMGGREIRRPGNFLRVEYMPDGISVEGGEVGSLTRVWPEAHGSTIEFCAISDF